MKETGRRARGTRLPSRRSAESGFSPLPYRGRVALLVVLGLVMIVDIVLFSVEPASNSRDMALGLAATLAAALFAWWPPAAAITLLLTALVETSSGQGGSHLLYLVVVAGLVVYTCPAWFVGLYAAAVAALAVFTANIPGAFSSTALPVLGLVMLVSAGIGWALCAAHRRERRFARDIEQLTRARAAAIEAERARIADELHDIIAHDVTLVSMHARVLERVDDPALHAQSVRAIRSSADQALADIRRMLRIVRDDRTTASNRDDDHASAWSALEEITTALERLGAEVTVHARVDVELSAAIEQTLVHVLREGATNIAKHGAARPRVRIVVESIESELRVELSNTIGGVPGAPHVPSSGYGLDRLKERVTLLDGRLTTGCVDGTWTMNVRLPVL